MELVTLLLVQLVGLVASCYAIGCLDQQRWGHVQLRVAPEIRAWVVWILLANQSLELEIYLHPKQPVKLCDLLNLRLWVRHWFVVCHLLLEHALVGREVKEGPFAPSFQSLEFYHHFLGHEGLYVRHLPLQIGWIGILGPKYDDLHDLANLEVVPFCSNRRALVHLNGRHDPLLQHVLINGADTSDIKLTRISDTDSNVTSLELTSIQCQCGLETFQRAKLCISEALWFHFHLVLNDTNIDTFAADKEFVDIADGGIE